MLTRINERACRCGQGKPTCLGSSRLHEICWFLFGGNTQNVEVPGQGQTVVDDRCWPECHMTSDRTLCCASHQRRLQAEESRDEFSNHKLQRTWLAHNARPHLARQEPWNRLASRLTLPVFAFDSISLVLTSIAPKASHARNARTCPTASSGRASSASDGVLAYKTGNMYDEQLKRRVVTVVECPAVSLDLNETSCKTTPAISLLIAPQTLY